MRPALFIRLRRQVYTLILAVLFAGFSWFTAGDAEGTVALDLASPEVVPAANLHSLTQGKSLDGFGSFASDGSKIAFMRDGRIWVMSVGGETPHPVTSPESDWDAVPAWRPGAEQIAYIRHARDGARAEVRLLEVASGKEQRLAVESVSIGHVAWAPDGKSLYYTTAQRLMQVTIGNRKSRQVLGVSADWEMLAGGVAITRDGQQAIFGAGPRTEKGTDYNIWRAPINGRKGQPEQLTRTGGIMPAVDARGEWLAFRSPLLSPGIYLLRLSTGQTQLLAHDEERAMYFHPSFAPDGKQLMFSRLALDGNPAGKGAARFTSSLCLMPMPESESESNGN